MTEEESLIAWTTKRDPTLRDEARRAIEAGRPWDSFLLRKIQDNVIDAECLYRGTTVSASDPLLSVKVGDSFSMLPSSWSAEHQIAAQFFRNQFRPKDVPLFMLLQGRPIHGFDLAEYFEAKGHPRARLVGGIDLATYFDARSRSHLTAQREVITAGRFQVLDAQALHEGSLLIVKQTGVYGREL
jgi:hypothetical protein